jgi:hypothetical protein
MSRLVKVEHFDADRIAGAKETLGAQIPNYECEVPAQPTHEGLTPTRVGLEREVGVCLATKRPSKISPKFGGIMQSPFKRANEIK